MIGPLGLRRGFEIRFDPSFDSLAEGLDAGRAFVVLDRSLEEIISDDQAELQSITTILFRVEIRNLEAVQRNALLLIIQVEHSGLARGEPDVDGLTLTEPSHGDIGSPIVGDQVLHGSVSLVDDLNATLWVSQSPDGQLRPDGQNQCQDAQDDPSSLRHETPCRRLQTQG
jgi:hypothetical protein